MGSGLLLCPAWLTISIMSVEQEQPYVIKKLTHEFQVELLQRISTIESRLAELSGQGNRNE
jgi:hypothetical protein